MGNGYDVDKNWSDKYIPEIKKIVGPLLLDAAPFELDATEATDLIVLKMRDMRIAARVRRPGYFKSFWDQFTLRNGRSNGVMTETKKILVDGFGDWLFYGHAYHKCVVHIEHWMIVDLHAWRAIVRDPEKLGVVKKAGGIIKRVNTDNATDFVAFRISCFPTEPKILVDTNIDALRDWM